SAKHHREKNSPPRLAGRLPWGFPRHQSSMIASCLPNPPPGTRNSTWNGKSRSIADLVTSPLRLVTTPFSPFAHISYEGWHRVLHLLAYSQIGKHQVIYFVKEVDPFNASSCFLPWHQRPLDEDTSVFIQVPINIRAKEKLGSGGDFGEFYVGIYIEAL